MEIMLSQLVAQLTRLASVQVIGPCGNNGRNTETNVIRPAKGGLMRFMSFAFFLGMRLLRQNKYDVIFAGSALLAPLAVVLGTLFRRPVVIYIHGLDLLYDHPVYQWLMRIFLPRCRFFFANSRHTANLANQLGVPDEKIEIINPGLDFSEFAALPAADEIDDQLDLHNHLVLLSAGRLAQRKGIPEFVEHVLPALVASHPDLLFLVAGENPTESLTHKEDIKGRIAAVAKAAHVEEHVRLLGFVSRAQLLRLFAACDIFILPAIYMPGDVEGFGIVLIEAGAAGKPVVSTRLGGISDAVADNQTGRLVEAG
ncbi:MAG: glycosyltransferase family 4 protein, partial [Anaerolineales bacterium]|nr:glycosyltransferase family 4 protein [Anaerolineales bacterium]